MQMNGRKWASVSVSGGVQLCPKVSSCVRRCPKVSEGAQQCPAVSSCVQLCPKVPSGVRRCPKVSKGVFHMNLGSFVKSFRKKGGGGTLSSWP